MAKKKKEQVKVIPEEPMIWAVAYIDSGQLEKVEKELTRYKEYEQVTAYIPTIKILRKTFKKENIFEDVPLLFNYGFFKMPRKYAIYRNYLDNMQKNISCIYAWVRDPMANITKGAENISCAVAFPHEVNALIDRAVNLGAHSAEDLTLIKEGDLVTLKGYPWDGMQAEFISRDEKKQKVKVRLLIFNSSREVDVSYDNVFFTIYHNFNDAVGDSRESLDGMADAKTLDRVMHKNCK